MKKYLLLLFLPFFFLSSFTAPQPVSAADFRTGDEITIPSGTENLEDLYLFGGNIRVDSPVTNDVVAAGGSIDLLRDVSGSIIVAGGNITISGNTGNTVRAAGGNIRINGDIRRDLVVTGGSISVSRDAVIERDAVISGGTIILDGPVQGKVIVNGGNVTLNSTIDGNVEGHVEKLSLGPNAQINGNLTYKSEEKAQVASGAIVQGRTTHTPIDRSESRDDARELVTAGAIYKLVADILLSILFIYFFARALTGVLARFTAKPIENGAIGFAFIVLFPIAALVGFILIWLGIAALLSYALVLLVSLFVVKVFLGWWLMRWWQGRNKKQYALDWKAGVIGPIVLFIVGLIPFIGWLAVALLVFIATGAVLGELFTLMRGQKVVPQKAPARKR